MKRFFYLLLLVWFSTLVLAQTPQGVDLIELTNEEAEQFIKHPSAKFAKGKPIVNVAQEGKHYLMSYESLGKHAYKLTSNNTFRVDIIPLDNSLCCRVTKRSGEIISTASVHIGNTVVPYNSALGCYQISKLYKNEILTVQCGNELAFVRVEGEKYKVVKSTSDSKISGFVVFDRAQLYEADTNYFSVYVCDSIVRKIAMPIKVRIYRYATLKTDTVLQYLPGRGFAIPPMENGDYKLEITISPRCRIYSAFKLHWDDLTWWVSLPDRGMQLDSIKVDCGFLQNGKRLKTVPNCEASLKLVSTDSLYQKTGSIHRYMCNQSVLPKSGDSNPLTIPASCFLFPKATYSLWVDCRNSRASTYISYHKEFLIDVYREGDKISYVRSPDKKVEYKPSAGKEPVWFTYAFSSDSVQCRLQNPRRLPLVVEYWNDSMRQHAADTSFLLSLSRNDLNQYQIRIFYQDSTALKVIFAQLNASSDCSPEKSSLWMYTRSERAGLYVYPYLTIQRKNGKPIVVSEIDSVLAEPLRRGVFMRQLNAPVGERASYYNHKSIELTEIVYRKKIKSAEENPVQQEYFPLNDSTAQISPMIFKNGKSEYVYMVKIDGIPVYVNGLRKNNPNEGNYSFVASPGYHAVSLYTHHRVYTIDSVLLKKNQRLVYSVYRKRVKNIQHRFRLPWLPGEDLRYLREHQMCLYASESSGAWVGSEFNMMRLEYKTILYPVDSTVYWFHPLTGLQTIHLSHGRTFVWKNGNLRDTSVTEAFDIARRFKKRVGFYSEKVKHSAVTSENFRQRKPVFSQSTDTYYSNGTLIISISSALPWDYSDTRSIVGFALVNKDRILLHPNSRLPWYNVVPGDYRLYAATSDGTLYFIDSFTLKREKLELVEVKKWEEVSDEDLLRRILSLQNYAYRLGQKLPVYYWKLHEEYPVVWSDSLLQLSDRDQYFTNSASLRFNRRNRYWALGASLLGGVPSAGNEFISRTLCPGISVEGYRKFHQRLTAVAEFTFQRMDIPSAQYTSYHERLSVLFQADLFANRSRYQKRPKWQAYAQCGLSAARFKKAQTLMFPLGLGLLYKYNKQINIGVEYTNYFMSLEKLNLKPSDPVHGIPVFAQMKLRLQYIIPKKVMHIHFR